MCCAVLNLQDYTYESKTILHMHCLNTGESNYPLALFEWLRKKIVQELFELLRKKLSSWIVVILEKEIILMHHLNGWETLTLVSAVTLTQNTTFAHNSILFHFSIYMLLYRLLNPLHFRDCNWTDPETKRFAGENRHDSYACVNVRVIIFSSFRHFL